MKPLTPELEEFRRKIIRAVYIDLRKKKMVVRANYLCCTSCASKSVADLIKHQKKEGGVFWSRQEEVLMRKAGFLKINCLPPVDTKEAWESVAETMHIAVKKQGFVTEWSGNPKDPIVIKNELLPEFRPVQAAQELLSEHAEVMNKIRAQKAMLAHEMASLAAKETEMNKSMNQNREVLNQAFSKYETKVLKTEDPDGAKTNEGRHSSMA